MDKKSGILLRKYFVSQNQFGGETMKYRISEFIFVMVFLFVMVFNMVGLAVNAFANDINDLPSGNFLYSTMSPDGNSTLKIYRVSINNIGTAIRGEVITKNENGETLTKNIYWQTDEKNAIASWEDSEYVTINDKRININGNPYDSRKEIELPEATPKNLTSN